LWFERVQQKQVELDFQMVAALPKWLLMRASLMSSQKASEWSQVEFQTTQEDALELHGQVDELEVAVAIDQRQE
jgi:hypothetical protein